MATWIFVISAKYPDHWDRAKTDGFWDTKQRTKIARGDDVCFWQGGGSFVGWTRATTATFELSASDPAANWGNVSNGGYRFRFKFHIISSEPIQQLTWTEMSNATGNAAKANVVRVEIKNVEGHLYLPTLFNVNSSIEVSYPVGNTKYEYGDDMRDRARRLISIRRGQGVFRDSLIDAYGGTCVVTGSADLSVLEAAHIDRYFGAHSNHVTNGLLLRADIHTLFDLLRITVDENLLVRVDPKLTGTEYEPLDGTPLRLPANQAQHPDMKALRRHCESCSWMPKTPATA